ncbi:hypothetical protein RRG08_021123 [Elysia crispata]|uniref:Uncharacterized protein n=1 Tax=Elysia crispata TaxID=231223 RepID=A0AAE0Z614_9GAST|nr:hypothetical protein RRG08_021123 [Elysia crispata]
MSIFLNDSICVAWRSHLELQKDKKRLPPLESCSKAGAMASYWLSWKPTVKPEFVKTITKISDPWGTGIVGIPSFLQSRF